MLALYRTAKHVLEGGVMLKTGGGRESSPCSSSWNLRTHPSTKRHGQLVFLFVPRLFLPRDSPPRQHRVAATQAHPRRKQPAQCPSELVGSPSLRLQCSSRGSGVAATVQDWQVRKRLYRPQPLSGPVGTPGMKDEHLFRPPPAALKSEFAVLWSPPLTPYLLPNEQPGRIAVPVGGGVHAVQGGAAVA